MYEVYRLHDLIDECNRSAESWSGERTDQESNMTVP